ncbi:hypothetical protein ASG22_16030 [Chryseobacterium sp. Leaf405]|nr:hypothetical protein ASG22_16030 [Chryseobacterium sp. Leaf405]
MFKVKNQLQEEPFAPLNYINFKKLKNNYSFKTSETMKNKRRRKIKRNREKLQNPRKDISDLIDELAYADEKENMQKSKKILDDMYILDLE